MDMETGLIGRTGVRGDEDMEVQLKSVPGRRRHTAFGGEARQHQGIDATSVELIAKAGAGKSAVAVLGDDGLARPGLWPDEIRTMGAFHTEIRSIFVLAGASFANDAAFRSGI